MLLVISTAQEVIDPVEILSEPVALMECGQEHLQLVLVSLFYGIDHSVRYKNAMEFPHATCISQRANV